MEIKIISKIENVLEDRESSLIVRDFSGVFYTFKEAKDLFGRYEYFWRIPDDYVKGLEFSKRFRPKLIDIYGQLESTDYILCTGRGKIKQFTLTLKKQTKCLN